MIQFVPEHTWGCRLGHLRWQITGATVSEVESKPGQPDLLTIEWSDGERRMRCKANYPAGQIALGDTVTIEGDPLAVLRGYPVMDVPPLAVMRDRAITEAMEHDA